MENKKTLNTKKLLKEALVSLLCETTIDRIGVSELCRVAKLNRSTFYAHYESITDLFDDIEDEYLSNMPVLFPSLSDDEISTELHRYTDYINRNKETFKVLVRNGRLNQSFTNHWKKQQLPEGRMLSFKEKEKYDLLSSYTISGMTAVYRYWLDKGRYLTEDDIVALILKIFRTNVALQEC